MTIPPRSIHLAALSLALVGCTLDGADLDEPAEDAAFAEKSGRTVIIEPLIRQQELAPKCKGLNCGMNGVILDFPFHDLNAAGLPNDKGLYITAFLAAPDKAGVRRPLTLVVEDDVLTGFDGDTELTGDDLLGARLMIAKVPGSDDLSYPVLPDQVVAEPEPKIDPKPDEYGLPTSDPVTGYVIEIVPEPTALKTTSFWIGADADDMVPTYKLQYRPLDAPEDAPFEPVCDEWLGEGHAIVFQGDGYDAASISVFDDPWSGRWFNIACLGGTLSKMHLLRHTAAGSTATYQTEIGERQAVLKMLTADYCGLGQGHTFTENGTRLNYITSRGWHIPGLAPDLFGITDSVDALWDEDGLVCLNYPRLAPWGGLATNLLLADIASTCSYPSMFDIPHCEDVHDRAYWGGLGYVMSTNPAP
jgi:hypothetical protein